jgi:hypothetical protein
MMTSFRWWPPLCPNTDSVQLHSIDSLRLLACLALLGVVQMTRHCSNLASAVHKTLCRRRLHCHASRSFSTAVAFSPRSRVACHTIFKASLLIVASCPRFYSLTSCTQFYLAASCFFYRRSFADVNSLLQMHNSILPFADVQQLLLQPDSLPTSLHRSFLIEVTRDEEFFSVAVTWNFTIDDGLEVELDKMMTSFCWWPPLCHNTDSVQLHSIDSLRLLACLALLGVVQMTRQNDTSLLELGIGRSQDSLPTPTSLPCQSQFLDGGRLLATISRRLSHGSQSLLSD